MRVRASALKHGIEAADCLFAAQHPIFVRDLGDDPQRQLRLGFDRHARLLELVVLTGDDGDQLVIHAMKAREQYLRLLD